MKTLTVKFARNPKYTPASLTNHQLSRIEALVKALFANRVLGGEAESPKEALKNFKAYGAKVWAFDIIKHSAYGMVQDLSQQERRKNNHIRRWNWLYTNKDATKYFSNCWNYLLTVALRNNETSEPENLGKSKYAQIYGSY
jgi:hypothetical protein